MGHYVLISACGVDPAQALSGDLRRRCEGAGWAVVELSAAAWLALAGPHRPDRVAVGSWTLVGDVLHRHRPELPSGKRDDPWDYERKLMARFWGRYVGVQLGADGRIRSLLRDPSGAMECVAWDQDGLLVVASTLPDWLLGGLSIRWRPNPETLGLAMRDPMSSADWLLMDGPVTIAPGTVQPLPLTSPPVAVWTPAEFARRSLSSHWTLDEALATLASAVDDAVAGLGGLAGTLAAEVSGGLDSSTVAGSLVRNARIPVALWLNAYGATPEADERVYVDALAKTLEISPTLLPHAAGSLTEAMLERISGDFRPGLNALDVHHDMAWARRVTAAGASVLMTGKGGDSIFLQNASPDVFTDAWKARGWRALLSKDVARLAARNEVSVWTMIGRARRDTRQSGFSLLRDDALLPVKGETPGLSHPWLTGSEAFGPAKIRQIAGVIDSVSRHGPSVLTETIDVRHPLCAQPVIEACLAIPATLLTIGGRDRGLVRRAFRDRLPERIVERRSKGDMTRIYGRMVLSSLDVLRPWLLDGKLAASGLIDRTRTEAALTEESLMWKGQFGAIIRAAAFEGWLRVWSGRFEGASH
jgi:asparagine synthase (glutamine-hydrolysing)